MKNKIRIIIVSVLSVLCLCNNSVFAECGNENNVVNNGNGNEETAHGIYYIDYYYCDADNYYTTKYADVNESITILGCPDSGNNNPVNQGNVFVSWNTHADGSGTAYSADTSITLKENLNLYAQWQNYYSFSFVSDGNVISSARSPYKNIPELPEPEKTGYTFDGWYISVNSQDVKVNKGETLTADMLSGGTSTTDGSVTTITFTLSAKWIENCTVTFNTTDHPNITVASQSITPGDKATKPVVKADGDYTIVGWYTEPELTTVWDFNEDVVSADITLYAKWENQKALSIDGTDYSASQFKEKLADLSGTVKLYTDIGLGTDYINVSDGKSLILDLNGHSLSSDASAVINMTGGSLTIKDTAEAHSGKIVGKKNVIYCKNSSLENDASIIIDNGTFEGGQWVIYTNYTLNNAFCDVTINGGTFTSTSKNAYGAVRIASPGEITINGGTFSGIKSLLINAAQIPYINNIGYELPTLYADVRINGGTFNNAVDFKNGQFYLKGGNFKDFEDVSDYCALGYIATEETDGSYDVSLNPNAAKVAKIGTTEYVSLQDAIDAAKDNETITLIANISSFSDMKEEVVIKKDKNITIDLNGYQLGSEGNTVTNYGTASIINSKTGSESYIRTTFSSENCSIKNCGNMYIGENIDIIGFYGIYNVGTMEFKATTEDNCYFGLFMDAGTVNITGGLLSGYYNGAHVANGTLNINGGQITITNSVNQGAIITAINNAIVNINGGIISATDDSENTDGIWTYNNSTITMNGGTINDTRYGIFTTGESKLVINDGTISTERGLQISGGNVEVNGGTIASTEGTALFVYAKVGKDRTNTYNIVININGGEFSSDSDSAIIAKYHAEVEHEIPLVNINGGKFRCAADKEMIVSEEDFDGKITVSGGLFSAKFVSEMLASSYEFKDNTDETTKAVYPYKVGKIVVPSSSSDDDDKTSSDTTVVTPVTVKKTVASGTKIISELEKVITKDDGSSLRQIINKNNSDVKIVADTKLIPSGTILEQKELSKDSEDYKVVEEAIRNNADLKLDEAKEVFAYDFDLTKSNGTEIHELDGYVEVSLPVPSGITVGTNQHITAYRVNDDGSLTKCDTEVKDGVITFKTNHFSTYIFALEEDEVKGKAVTTTDTTNEVTEEVTETTTSTVSTGVKLPIIIVCVVILAGIIFVTIKVKNNK